MAAGVGGRRFVRGGRHLGGGDGGGAADFDDARLATYRQCLAKGNPLNHVRAGVYAAAAVAWLRAFAPPQFLWIETEEMRAMDGATLLTRVGRHAGLPTAHLAALPSAVRGACERWRFFDPADGRARTHDHALPPAEALPRERSTLHSTRC